MDPTPPAYGASPTGDPGAGQVRRPGKWPRRLVALGATAALVVGVGQLRVDAARIEQEAAAAHRAGQCGRATEILDRLWVAHDVADPPLAARAEDAQAACQLVLRAEEEAPRDRLRAAEALRQYGKQPGALWKGADDRRAELLLAEAEHELTSGLTYDEVALDAGFNQLLNVLEEYPSRSKRVDQVLDGFLGELPAGDACNTKGITDWLRGRETMARSLDGTAGVVDRLAPAAIIGCGDQLMKRNAPSQARTAYHQFREHYPGHPLAAKARQGERRAAQAVQLEEVRSLLGDIDVEGQAAYCDNPEPYAGAKPYSDEGGGPYPALFFGADDHAKKLPASWVTEDAAEAVLVICAGDRTRGSFVESCTYLTSSPSGKQKVDFWADKVALRVYELRTGQQIMLTGGGVEVGGGCPFTLETPRYGDISEDETAVPNERDVRAAYDQLLDP